MATSILWRAIWCARRNGAHARGSPDASPLAAGTDRFDGRPPEAALCCACMQPAYLGAVCTCLGAQQRKQRLIPTRQKKARALRAPIVLDCYYFFTPIPIFFNRYSIAWPETRNSVAIRSTKVSSGIFSAATSFL